MVTVGLCGGSGSGKGTLCAIFGEMGIPSFDCDAVYHGMISSDSEVTQELAEVFGSEILSPIGGVDRRRLAAIVFSPERRDALKTLNEITHRHVKSACFSWLDEMRKAGCAAVIVDAPLLFESGFDSFCDMTVALTASRETRIARITARDGIGREAAEKRIDAQIGDAELARLSDTVIENNGGKAELRLSAEALLNKILKEKKP